MNQEGSMLILVSIINNIYLYTMNNMVYDYNNKYDTLRPK